LLGNVGKGDPRAYTLISETLGAAFEKPDFGLSIASGEALVALGDPRGVALLEQISKNVNDTPQLRQLVNQYQDRLRKVAETPAKPATQRP
jgi:HEAT repeat protein